MGISSDQQVRSPALSLLTRYVSSVSWSDYFGKMTPETLKWMVTCVWLSVAAMVGCFFRIVLAQLFGEECANPGTVGWLAAGSPLCVTAGGNADVQGGIVFAVRSNFVKRTGAKGLLGRAFGSHTRIFRFLKS